MAANRYHYSVRVVWTGDRGEGTSDYRSYGRDHIVEADGKPDLPGSADRTFRGDAERWNPEELLVAALSQCHMLSYLHLCAVSGVVVVGYEDHPEGEMKLTADGGGGFVQATLRPLVTVADGSMLDAAGELHAPASERCFIARSVDFPVHHEPRARVG